MISRTGINIKAWCLGLLILSACGTDEPVNINLDLIGTADDADAYLGVIYENLVQRDLLIDAFVIMPLLFSDNCYYAGSSNTSWMEASDMDIDPENTVNSNMFSDLYTANNDLNVLFGQLDTTDHESLTEEVKDGFRAEGQALRAVLYFYLNNYWGNVPLVDENTDQADTTLDNSAEGALFEFIEGDLLFAEENIGLNTYVSGTQRLGEDAINAWLARVYLQYGEWNKALQYAEEVILSGSAQLETSVQNIYNINSDEHLWVLAENESDISLAVWFLQPFSNGQYVVRPRSVIPFEAGDARRNTALSAPGTTVFKYTDISSNSDPAYMIRLAELYLIAAEAAIRSTADYTTATDYLNVVRNRAGLDDVTLDAGNYEELILQERNAELCYEGFHRLFDLRRFGKAEEVLGEFGYDAKDDLWPIPQRILDEFSNIEQNPGY